MPFKNLHGTIKRIQDNIDFLIKKNIFFQIFLLHVIACAKQINFQFINFFLNYRKCLKNRYAEHPVYIVYVYRRTF